MHVWLYSTLLFILRQILQSVMRKETRKIHFSCKYRWTPGERLIISFQRLYGSKTVDFLLLSPRQSKCLVAFFPCLPPIFSSTVKMRNKTAIKTNFVKDTRGDMLPEREIWASKFQRAELSLFLLFEGGMEAGMENPEIHQIDAIRMHAKDTFTRPSRSTPRSQVAFCFADSKLSKHNISLIVPNFLSLAETKHSSQFHSVQNKWFDLPL